MRMTHDFDWNNIQILDKEPCYNKRLISEMLNIKKQKNLILLCLNFQIDKAFTKPIQR